MVPEAIHDLLDASAALALHGDRLRQDPVTAGALGLGERVVGDVAREFAPERELVVADIEQRQVGESEE